MAGPLSRTVLALSTACESLVIGGGGRRYERCRVSSDSVRLMMDWVYCQRLTRVNGSKIAFTRHKQLRKRQAGGICEAERT